MAIPSAIQVILMFTYFQKSGKRVCISHGRHCYDEIARPGLVARNVKPLETACLTPVFRTVHLRLKLKQGFGYREEDEVRYVHTSGAKVH